jgi:hypothetical protein
MWSVSRCYKQGVRFLAVKRRQEVGVKWPRVSCKKAQLKVRFWREDFMCAAVQWYMECVIQWDYYSSYIKIRCQETATGECNILRILVGVCQWPVTCSHESWVYKWSINRVANPNPVYSHSLTWQYCMKSHETVSRIWFRSIAAWANVLGKIIL